MKSGRPLRHPASKLLAIIMHSISSRRRSSEKITTGQKSTRSFHTVSERSLRLLQRQLIALLTTFSITVITSSNNNNHNNNNNDDNSIV